MGANQDQQVEGLQEIWWKSLQMSILRSGCLLDRIDHDLPKDAKCASEKVDEKKLSLFVQNVRQTRDFVQIHAFENFTARTLEILVS